MPSFDEVLQQVVQVLERDGRSSYRALKRRFELDDEYIEDLKAELIDCRGAARDHDGRVLIWVPQESVVPPGSQLSAPSDSEAARERPAMNPAFGERRQLTVLFCDIVSSTELASRLDPEEYGDILGAYHAKCATAILRYGGHIAQYLGDGVYAYFGYPSAREDAASRAVHAALAVLDELRAGLDRDDQRHATELAVRIGIHTGVVVMGDVGASQHLERMALGDAPSIAARIQAQASVNTIVVSAATRELLRDEWRLEALGAHELRGVPKPVALFRVLGPERVSRECIGPDESAQAPLFGRTAELELLRARFVDAQQARGQIVAISGEAGIGKSRLLRAFRESVAAEQHTYWECRCSELHAATALHPLTELIRRRFFLRDGEPERTSLAKLRRGFARAGHGTSALPLLAALLSISPLPPEVASLTRAQQRRKLIEMFVLLLLERASREPVVFVIDDLHWADPSTLEVLSALVEQVPNKRALVLTGYRPGFEPSWRSRDRTTLVTLDRLSQAQAAALVERIAGGKSLPARLLAELLDKTDGVPMFIEESTRMLLGSARVIDRGDSYQLVDGAGELGVPSTIQDSLMARLDQLSSAKEVAQLAAILGRTFHYELIAALWSVEERLLVELTRLVEAGLLLQRGLPPEAVFSFKHALIQDVSYASTLKRVRRSTHCEVAKLLIRKFPQVAAAEPELIAHHFTEAGMAAEAVEYWRLAADKALSAFANLEAVQHLQRALRLIDGLPDTSARADLELSLIINLGPPLIATQGYSSSELKRVYERAHALCQTIGDPLALWSVLYVLFFYYSTRGETESAREVAKALEGAAQRTDDGDLLLEMCIVNGHAFWSGHFDAARRAFESVLEAYDSIRHAGHAAQFGHDPLVSALAYLAWIHAVQGDPEGSTELAQRAIEHARSIEHPHSLGYALAFAAVNSQLLGNYASSRAFAREAHALSLEHSLAHWLADADILHGFADVMEHGTSEGLARLRAGLQAWDVLGARLWRTHQLGLLAEAQLRFNQPQRALELLSEAQAQLLRSDERYYEAELYRLEGEAHLQLDPRAPQAALNCFRRAVQIAHDQGASTFEKRAREALEKCETGRRSDTHAIALPAPQRLGSN